MIYKFTLGLWLLVGPHCILTQDMTTEKKNIAEDNPSFSLHNNITKRSLENDIITAGNTMCKQGNKCGYHGGTSYSWCYTDYSWEYCCTGECHEHENDIVGNYMFCTTGSTYALCGKAGSRTVKGTACLTTHQCGVHDSHNTIHNTYWCYIDEKKNSESCCNPIGKCTVRNDGYGYWCVTSKFFITAKWDYCSP